MADSPYPLWTSRKSLGVMRDVRSEIFYFGQFFLNGMRSTDEWIDFTKLPIKNRDLAPFVKPKGRGRGVSTDRATGYRFKPANIVLEDAIDPDRGFTYEAGIDGSPFDMLTLSVSQRRELIKAQMLADFNDAMDRRWEWMKARAIIDGSVTCVYEDGEIAVVDFQRAAGHSEVLGVGDRYGDAGVSILDHWKAVANTMNDASFGGVPVRITMSSTVAALVQADAEIRDHMDINIRGGVVTVDRGPLVDGPDGAKVYKFGELTFGGGSGQRVELWVNNEEYRAPSGTMTRYLASNQVLFTSTPSAINGYECFGRIVDPDAAYEALPKFPKNFMTGDRVKTENLSMESAPLFVPINPNATYKATVLA